jgi:hypothetical protein
MTEQPLTQAQAALLEQMKTPGSVLYGILAWMSDSMMMHRLLPVFTDLMTDAGRAMCIEVNDPCAEHWPNERHRWCEGCCLLDIAHRVEEAATP